ncbi:MAG: hydantoinase/oxoprolinase family protein, partial [Desulfitobacterium hafniense]|nr:hydantoinase/oxoprolinase family protein [Desulfitobacterium hafniense]
MNTGVGIDVGGTFTDAVLIRGNSIESKCKIPTNTENLVETLVLALDHLGKGATTAEQITVSTTLVTNAILQKSFPKVELFLFPGTGMKLESLRWPMSYNVLSGEIDYRGREICPPDELEWRRLINKLSQLESGIHHIAVVGKFSHRNKQHEEALGNFLIKRNPNLKVSLGHEWGQANFFRRSQTTYLNLASSDLFRLFADDLQKAISSRGSKATIRV